MRKNPSPPTDPLCVTAVSCFAFTRGCDGHDADGRTLPQRLELRILRSSARPSRRAPIKSGVIHPHRAAAVALVTTTRRKSCVNTDEGATGRTRRQRSSPQYNAVFTAYATRGRRQASIACRRHHTTTLHAVWPTSACNTAGLRSSIHESPIRGNPRIITPLPRGIAALHLSLLSLSLLSVLSGSIYRRAPHFHPWKLGSALDHHICG